MTMPHSRSRIALLPRSSTSSNRSGSSSSSILLLSILAFLHMAAAGATRALASRSSSPHGAYIGSWTASSLLRRRGAPSGSGSTRLESSRLIQQPRHQPRASFSHGPQARRVQGTGLREDLTRLWSTLSNSTVVSQVGSYSNVCLSVACRLSRVVDGSSHDVTN